MDLSKTRSEEHTHLGRRSIKVSHPASFDAQLGPKGALLVGDPDRIAEKIHRHSEALGGVSRVTFQMDNAALPQNKLLNSIELIGQKVLPQVH